jgi:hypothetical protein
MLLDEAKPHFGTSAKMPMMDSRGQRTMTDFSVSERILDGAYGAARLIGRAEKGTLGPVESWRVAE